MGKPRLLLVDDDALFLRTLGGALERKGYGVRTAETGEAALVAVAEAPAEVILLDLMLGERSSLPLIEPLMASCPRARLIMLTGYASVATTVAAMRLGATDYLAKPVGLGEVLQALGRGSAGTETDAAEAPPQPIPLARVEWEHIQRVLADHDGNISAAARALGVHRRSLQRKLAKRPPPPRPVD
jgi:two-component system, response regulator RegA